MRKKSSKNKRIESAVLCYCGGGHGENKEGSNEG